MSAPYPKADASWDICADQYTPITDADIDRAAASLIDPSPVSQAIADIAEEFSKYDPFMMGHGDGSGEPWVPERFVGRPEISVGVCCGDMAHCMAPDCDSSKLNRDARKASLDSLQRMADKTAAKAAALRERFAPNTKPTNPKDSVGIRKVSLSVLPFNVLAEVAVGMMEGAAKYGRHNYRGAGVRSSVYYDATMRHLGSYWEGEDTDPDSGLSHITKAICSLVVWRDAMMQSKLTDDRPPQSVAFMAALNEASAAVLERHADKSPKHWTIEDAT